MEQQLDQKYRDKIVSLERKVKEQRSETRSAILEKKKLNIKIEDLKHKYDEALEECKQKEAYLEMLKQYSQISIICGDKEDMQMIESLSNTKLPDMKRLSITGIKDGLRSLSDFFDNSCPDDLGILSLKSDVMKAIDVGGYLGALTQWFEITKTQVSLIGIKASRFDLNDIVKSSSQCNTLILDSSELEVEGDLDFNIEGIYKMRVFQIQRCEFIGGEIRKKKKYPLMNVLKAISNSGLKDSIQEIYL